MTFSYKIILELFSAILLALGLPNEILIFGSPVLGLMALIPHFTVLKETKTLKETMILCFIQCISVHFLSSWWLGLLKGYGVFTLGSSAIATGFIHAIFGIFFFLPKYILSNKPYDARLKERIDNPVFWIIWYSSVYTVFELVKCNGFIGYPWGTLSSTAYNFKYLCQIADTAGTSMICFIYCLFASTYVFCEPSKENRKIIIGIVSILVLVTGYGAIQYHRPRHQSKQINVICIQQNLNPYAGKDDRASILKSEALSLKAIQDTQSLGIKPDLSIWSEGILHYPFPQGITHYSFFPESNPLLPFIAKTHIPTIIGGPYTVNFENLEFSNDALLFSEKGEFIGHYAKTHLVPLAEFIPFTEFKIVKNILQAVAGFSHGWTPGKEYKSFTIPIRSSEDPDAKLTFSMPICFEDAFCDTCRGLKKCGSEVFINLTDDSWSFTKTSEYQHYVISWFRAIEYRTTLIRSTNSGFTVVVDPSGYLRYSLPLFEETYLSAAVPVFENENTLYLLAGDWLSFILVIFIAVFTFYAIVSTEKSMKKTFSV